MYSIESVTANIDSHLGWIILWTIIGWTTGGIQIIEGVRLTRRDGVLGVPIFTVMFLLAHDSTFALNYQFWFNTVHHWYFDAYVFGMLGSVPFEAYLLYAFITQEISRYRGQIGLLGIVIFVVTMEVATYLVLWGTQYMMPGDPMHLATLACTCFVGVFFNIPMIMLRGSTQGQSRLYAWATLVGPASFSLLLFPTLSSLFVNSIFFGIGACTTILAIIYIILFEHYKNLENGIFSK